MICMRNGWSGEHSGIRKGRRRLKRAEIWDFGVCELWIGRIDGTVMVISSSADVDVTKSQKMSNKTQLEIYELRIKSALPLLLHHLSYQLRLTNSPTGSYLLIFQLLLPYATVKHISSAPAMSNRMYCSPSGQVYEYGQTYQSQYNPEHFWTPIDTARVDYNNPPDPAFYMHGPQFGDCFVQDQDRSILSRILRAIFCLS